MTMFRSGETQRGTQKMHHSMSWQVLVGLSGYSSSGGEGGPLEWWPPDFDLLICFWYDLHLQLLYAQFGCHKRKIMRGSSVNCITLRSVQAPGTERVSIVRHANFTVGRHCFATKSYFHHLSSRNSSNSMFFAYSGSVNFLASFSVSFPSNEMYENGVVIISVFMCLVLLFPFLSVITYSHFSINVLPMNGRYWGWCVAMAVWWPRIVHMLKTWCFRSSLLSKWHSIVTAAKGREKKLYSCNGAFGWTRGEHELGQQRRTEAPKRSSMHCSDPPFPSKIGDSAK